MKTPQEEAESLAAQCVDNLWSEEASPEGDARMVLASIPLAELIAVARAANQLVSAHTAVTHHNYEALLVDALQALRTTGRWME